jgi:segregation and condensation protein A
MEDYKIKLDVFEGPLDLLLYLVKKAEVDVYDIPILSITDQYLKYIELMKMLDLDIAGEFLWMASNLIYIKSKMLLPPDERQEETEEEEMDPRAELIRQLIEYKKFKEAAGYFEKMEGERKLYFPREAGLEIENPDPALDLGTLNLFDLLNAFSSVLQKIQVREDLKKIFDEEVSVEKKIEYIDKMLILTPVFAFQDLFVKVTSRMEVIATFLALLELIRQKKARVKQDANFGNIMIERAMENAG